MTVHASAKPADGASRLPAAAWLILGIVLVADIMDLLDSTITTIAAPTISVITTVYFGALAGGPAHAMTLSLLTVIAIGVLSCLAIPLLPRHAQPAGPH